MKKQLAHYIVFLLLIGAAFALPVQYTVTAIGTKTILVPVNVVNGNQTTVENTQGHEQYTASKTILDNCDMTCDFKMPRFDKPNVSIDKFTLSYTSKRFTAVFLSTNRNITTQSDDKIHVQIQQLRPEDVFAVDKIVPTTLNLGKNQVNILLRNVLGEQLSDVNVVISGTGIKTEGSIPIHVLAAGDKDYVFVTVDASESGPADILIKVTANTQADVLTLNYVSQLTVTAAEKPVSTLNATQLAQTVTSIRDTLKTYENDYLDKNSRGYLVSAVYDSIKSTKDNLDNAQVAISENRLEDAQKSIALAQLGLDDVKNGLANARTEQKSLIDKIKDNAIFITSVAAAIAVIIGAIEFHQKKFTELKERLAQKKKEAEKAAKKKRKKK